MVTKEIYDYIENGKVDQLYKKMERCFVLIDDIAERLIKGDLLSEFELSLYMDQATGVYSKISPVCGGLEAYRDNLEYNTELKEYNAITSTADGKVKTTDTNIVKAKARSSISEIRNYYSDFKSYLVSAEKIILTCQSRVKRISLEKTARSIDFTGDASNIPKERESNGW